MAAQLWALHHPDLDHAKLEEILHLAYSGRTSIPAVAGLGFDLYRMAGFRLCGQRAVRVDILERLADLIRPAIQYRPGLTAGEPPAGAADADGFVVTTAMTSLCGCAGEDFSEILRALGYVMSKRKGPAITKALVPLAPVSEFVPPAPVSEGAPVAATEADKASVSPDKAAEAPIPVAEPTEQPEQAQVAEHSPVSAVESTQAEALSSDAESAPQDGALEAQAVSEQGVSDEAQEVEVEIWRLQRQHRPRPHQGQGRHKGRHKDNTAGEQATGADKDAAPARRDRGSFKDRSQSGEGGKSEAGEGRSFRNKGSRLDHQKGRDGKPQNERGGQERGGKGPRQAGRDRPLSNWQDQPRQKANKEPDPNSPFAKLLALKAQMQGGSSDTDKG